MCPALWLFVYFLDRYPVFARLAPDHHPPTSSFQIAGITGMQHQTTFRAIFWDSMSIQFPQ
jgi:hypothetical protein